MGQFFLGRFFRDLDRFLGTNSLEASFEQLNSLETRSLDVSSLEGNSYLAKLVV